MKPPLRKEELLVQKDARELERLGYAQELLRGMGGFSNFAISFSIISILTGALTLFDYGLTMGGPLEMTLGWPLATAGTLLVALSMAELCSALPTSGGMYHWSAELGGPTWAWFTAWLNIVGLITAIAGIDYGCAEFLVPLLGLDSRSLHHPACLWLAVVDAWRHQSLRDPLGRLSQRFQRHGAYPRRCRVDRRLVVPCSQTASGFSPQSVFLQYPSCALFLALLVGTSPGTMDLHRF